MADESPRYLIAKRIADWIVEHRFTTPFGGDITKSDDRRAYCILFARPRTLDGLVRVFGPQFIMVDTQGPLGQGRRVYDSVEHALAFMAGGVRRPRHRRGEPSASAPEQGKVAMTEDTLRELLIWGWPRGCSFPVSPLGPPSWCCTRKR